MTTLQATKDPLLRGVSPTPSKIPVRSQRRMPLPTVTSCALDQENQDPRRWVQKPPLNIQHHHVDSAGPRPKARHQAETSQRLVGTTQHRNPLEELRPSPGGQNVGPEPPAQTEAPGAIEFVADPAALATILSGEGVKSCHLGRQPSLAKRVLIRGNQGRTTQRGQGVRASAYLAPRTPTHRLDPARASCFSRLEGPGPRGQTLCPQRLQALISPSGPSFHPSTRPSFQELRREAAGSSRTSVSQASGLLLETPVQPAFSLPKGEHEVVTHSDEGSVSSLGLAQRVPLRKKQEMTHGKDSLDYHLMSSPAPVSQRLPGHTVPCPSPFGRAQRVPSPGPPSLKSCSVLRHLTLQPKTRFTHVPSTPRVQQAQWLSGVSPQSCSEDPALPWVAVRLFEQESSIRSLEGSGKPPVATPSGSYSNRTPSLQEVKMQRIGILQQLLRQEVEGLVGAQCVPLNGGSSLDMVNLQPLLTEISRTLNATEHNSGTSYLPGLLQHSGLLEPCLPEDCREPQPCPPAEPGPPEACCRSEPEKPGPSLQAQLEVPESCPAAKPRPPEATCRSESETSEPFSQEQLEVPEPCPPAEPGPPESGRSEPETSEPFSQGQLEVPEPCPPAEPRPPGSCCRSEPEIAEPSPQEQLEVPEPCPPVEPGPLQPSTQGQAGPPGPCPRVQLGASEPCSLEHRSPESSLPPCCSQWAPATTSLIFSSQHPLCASPPICSLQSLRPPAGQAGKELAGKECEHGRSSSHCELCPCPTPTPAPGNPMLPLLPYLPPCPSLALPQEAGRSCTSSLLLPNGLVLGGGGGEERTCWKYRTPEPPLNSPWPSGPSSLAPRTLALRQRLKACLTAIHCFHEARLDDECAFYTSRAPPSGPTRVCTNPVATLLEWQEALCFIPVGSAAPQGSPS
ncbi:tastin isoform X2 [Sapajus apella]|uniref:Tastin isoform X2 n=1 Tax=Sapajus apella TaxID=9515 RepID=A0A6J3J624_SAPAP|nr:tastin isoform X2 [Sapajus apella]